MQAVDYAKELIQFESTSRLSNVDVSNYVDETLKRLGFETERIEHNDAAGIRKMSVVGKKGPGRGGLAYFGHTDVVPADPWRFSDHGPFQPTVVDGKLYGRGACDMKGSVACMLAAAEQIPSERLKKPVYITCTADEEIGYGGAIAVKQRSGLYLEMVTDDSLAIIGEPTRLEVVYAHKGTYGFTATSHGRAAHSSTSHGINANLKMIPFLAEMKEIHDEVQNDPRWQDAEFDPPAINWNIGINDHTKAVNITAPQSVCTVYYRPMPDQDPDSLLERAGAAAQRHGLDFQVMVRHIAVYVDPQSPFVQELVQLAGKTEPHTVSFGTDGNVLTELKRKVVLGPGDIAQAHTYDEWISLDQLEKGTALYSRLVEQYCC